MEKKLIRVPFEIELAKRIHNGEVDGKIVTRDGRTVRIVCWDYKSMSGNYPILALVSSETQELSFPYSEKGKYEDSLDLILEAPEYITFKDGDVIAYDDCDTMAIIKAEFFKNDSGDICSKSYITILDEKSLQQLSVSMNSARLATEEEKQKFVNILKVSKELKAKEYLKRFFGIEQKQEYEFKPFDKVLVRDNKDECWSANIFSHKDKNDEFNPWFCIGVSYKYCLPYNEKTKHLLGTTKNWEE